MIRSLGGAIHAAGTQIEFRELPELYDTFLRGNGSTLTLENRGREISVNACSPSEAMDFVLAVCTWGGITGTNRVWPRIRNHNPPEHVARQLLAACHRLKEGESGRVKALLELQQISGLGKSGAVSYASKHLRMLSPDLCVTLDSNLSKALDVPENYAGFDALSGECVSMAQQANMAASAGPRPAGRVWRAADIEACVFTRLFPWVVSPC